MFLLHFYIRWMLVMVIYFFMLLDSFVFTVVAENTEIHGLQGNNDVIKTQGKEHGL